MFPEVILAKIFAYRREFWRATHRERFTRTLNAISKKNTISSFKEEYPSDSYMHCYFD
jgi:hypothetical protein